MSIDTTDDTVDRAIQALEDLIPALKHMRGEQALSYGLLLLVMEFHLLNGQLRQLLRLKAINESLAERVAAQAELLSKRAKRKKT
jgi:hypothetical protein